MNASSDPLHELPDYKYLRPLGQGRSAHVYLATQLSLSRPVCVKILADTDPQFLIRFEREAELMAEVSHPNIVSVIDRGVAKGQHFIVMEFMDGGSLRDRMTADVPMELLKARDVISSVAAALNCLHGMGLVHRDVKPDNVLFDGNGQIKLSDFGIAAPLGQIGQLTDDNANPGTLDYMAPEQRHRLGVAREADQFALAVMAYELLTGRLPTRVFRQASTKNPALSSEVDSVLERALQEQPDARFPGVTAFAEALDRALSTSNSTADQPVTASVGIYHVLGALVIFALCAGWIFSEVPWKVNATERVNSTNATNVNSVSESEGPVQQTGALTYRVNSSGQLEVLIVSARSGGHWTIPKATQKKDKTLSSVAEEEAFEESGVRGKASSEVIGRYSYRRDDRLYEVSVVPVQSTEELSDWPESFRDRRWGTVEEISNSVASDKLRQIIQAFSLEAVETSPQ